MPRTTPRRRGTSGARLPTTPRQSAQARRPDGDGQSWRHRLHALPGCATVKLHSANPIERLIGEIKRPTEVIGIFPNEHAIVRLADAVLLEQNAE